MRLSSEESVRRFADGRVARLATVSPEGAPHVVPVVFAAHDDLIVLAVDHKPKSTVWLQRLINIRRDPRVCFLVDAYAEDWTQLWWVRADAHATVLEPGPGEWAHGIELLRTKYAQYQQQPPTAAVVVSNVTRWTGWSGS